MVEHARGFATGGVLRVDSVILEDDTEPHAFAVERFEVFSSSALIVIDDQTTAPAPNAHYFRGFADGDPGSPVVLSVRQDGLRGAVLRKNGVWLLRATPGGPLRSRKVEQHDLESQARAFQCGSDHLSNVQQSTALADIEWSDRQTSSAPESSATAASAEYVARVAIETDYEYYAMFGDVTLALDYLGDLFAFASTIYENEIATSLQLDYVSLWTTGADTDPWGATSGTSAALEEYRSFWRANRTSVDRSISHMLSGKDLGGGTAYVGSLCNTTYGYGLSASLVGTFELESPSSVWDIIVVTHEMGHSFNSPHTHQYCDFGGNPNPVDSCVPAQYGPSCAGASDQLPDGCPGGGQACGSIMSYCHLVSGGYANIALTLGLGHGYGNEPDRVPAQMYEHVLNRSWCLAPQVPDDCGNGLLDPGEECDGNDLGSAVCTGDCAGAPTCTSSCTIDLSTCTDGFCDSTAGESCGGCAADCVDTDAAVCGNGVCEANSGEDCVTCATDCDGRQGGKPSQRFCCGYGGSHPVGCSDNRCSDGAGESCSTGASTACCGDNLCSSGEPNAGWCDVNDCGGGAGYCGDGVCDTVEDFASCPADCAAPETCGDAVCDPWEDSASCSSDCGGGGPSCSNDGGVPDGASCSSNSECCSNKCRGPKNNKTCKAA